MTAKEGLENRAPSHTKDEVLMQLRFTSDFYLQKQNLKFSLVNVRKKPKTSLFFGREICTELV